MSFPSAPAALPAQELAVRKSEIAVRKSEIQAKQRAEALRAKEKERAALKAAADAAAGDPLDCSLFQVRLFFFCALLFCLVSFFSFRQNTYTTQTSEMQRKNKRSPRMSECARPLKVRGVCAFYRLESSALRGSRLRVAATRQQLHTGF